MSSDGGGLVTSFQLLILSLNLLKTKFLYLWWRRGGGLADQLLMLSPKLPKTQIPFVNGVGGGGERRGRYRGP